MAIPNQVPVFQELAQDFLTDPYKEWEPVQPLPKAQGRELGLAVQEREAVEGVDTVAEPGTAETAGSARGVKV